MTYSHSKKLSLTPEMPANEHVLSAQSPLLLWAPNTGASSNSCHQHLSGSACRWLMMFAVVSSNFGCAQKTLSIRRAPGHANSKGRCPWSQHRLMDAFSATNMCERRQLAPSCDLGSFHDADAEMSFPVHCFEEVTSKLCSFAKLVAWKGSHVGFFKGCLVLAPQPRRVAKTKHTFQGVAWKSGGRFG